MMNLRKFTLILTLLVAAGLSAYSQNDTISVKTIVAKTEKFNLEHPVEKVYLQFDKPYYAVGDTVWFKVYLTMDVHMPSNISKVVYVDILNSKDSIVQKLKLPVLGSTAFGDILLNKPLYKQDNYHIRAYTNWMRNSDAAYFFNKTIPVGNGVDKDVITNATITGLVKSGNAKIDAIIHYNTPDGRAYSGRKVSWKIQSTDDETLGKGKETTDALGNANITFTTKKTDGLNTAMLVTSLDLDNKSSNNSFSLKHVGAPMDVQIFPEGGDLINGIKNRVAFKAIKPNGLGIDVKGTITDNTGAVVATIASQHLGMGVFELQPENGKTYKASITFPDGTQNNYNLPAAKNNGMTINVSNADPEKVIITYYASDEFFQANRNKTIGTVGQVGQIICYGTQIPLVTKAWSRSVLKSSLTSGIVKFTIFAPNGDALAERSVFVQRDDQLKIDLKTEKTSYAPRQKVTVNVSAKKAAAPSEANLSVTVIDETKVPYDENSETTILTSLLLTSDLKGYVEKPNYYFNNPNDKTKADLDVLMLTQGYTRFLYKDILANRIPAVKFKPEDGITISGTLRTALAMPISKGIVNFSIKDKYVFLHTVTNPVGEFRFSKMFFPDSVSAVLDAKGSINSNNLMIMIDSDPYLPPTINNTAPDEIANIDTALVAYLKNNKQQTINSHVLKEVVIKDKVFEKKPSHDDYPSLMGLSSIPDQQIAGTSLIACTNVFECLRAMTAGLVYDDGQMYVRRGHTTGDSSTPVAIYYNGLPVDFNFLSSIDPKDVESVEIFLSDGVSGVNRNTGTKGIIVVNAKKVNKPKMTQDQIKALLASMANSSTSFSPKGYTMPRAFYNPKYTVAGNSPIGGDLRSTVYWSPRVITDKATGNATFEYFNADAKGSYRVIIEGIDADGNIGRTVYRYKVQ